LIQSLVIPGAPLSVRPGMTTVDFVDPLFTTSMDAAFTTVFAVKAKTHATACLCRARNAD